jgi:hypothetical protein
MTAPFAVLVLTLAAEATVVIPITMTHDSMANSIRWQIRCFTREQLILFPFLLYLISTNKFFDAFTISSLFTIPGYSKLIRTILKIDRSSNFSGPLYAHSLSKPDSPRNRPFLKMGRREWNVLGRRGPSPPLPSTTRGPSTFHSLQKPRGGAESLWLSRMQQPW